MSDDALLKQGYLGIVDMDKTIFASEEILSEITIIFVDRIGKGGFKLWILFLSTNNSLKLALLSKLIENHFLLN